MPTALCWAETWGMGSFEKGGECSRDEVFEKFGRSDTNGWS